MNHWLTFGGMVLALWVFAIATGIVAGIFIARIRHDSYDELREAMQALQAEVGKDLVPPIEAMVVRINDWLVERKVPR